MNLIMKMILQNSIKIHSNTNNKCCQSNNNNYMNNNNKNLFQVNNKISKKRKNSNHLRCNKLFKINCNKRKLNFNRFLTILIKIKCSNNQSQWNCKEILMIIIMIIYMKKMITLKKKFNNSKISINIFIINSNSSNNNKLNKEYKNIVVVKI